VRLLFFGSPEEAVPFLELCAREHQVAAVLTRPDRPAGRGLSLKPPPIKSAAGRLGLAVLQPERPGEAAAELKSLGAEMAVVVAYGSLLRPELLAATRLGFLNVHFSLLPRHRGACPIEWSLIRGDERSGVTLFWIDPGMDTGPVQSRAEVPVALSDDALSLRRTLIELGVRELGSALAEIAAGRVRREPQSGEASAAPKIRPEQARLDFARPAFELHNWVRGLAAGPRPYVTLRTSAGPCRLALLRTEPEPGAEQGPAGVLLRVERNRGFLIQCSPGRLWVRDVQPEGKKPISAADFLNGQRLRSGDRLEAIV
jgi:methionyl-tRNA formyltransferase